jgi:tRNA(Arg) A34 adenosine deaminase TadA
MLRLVHVATPDPDMQHHESRHRNPMTAHTTCPHCAASSRNRRSVLGALVGAATVFVVRSAPAAVDAASPEDIKFMRMAIDEARRADFPFGAVIVRENDVIARGRNRGRELNDPTDHGEIDAIRNAVAGPGGKALRGATLYTSGEPCPMCMGAILWCRFGRLVYAASMEQLATKMEQPALRAAEVAARWPFAPISITGGVLADEAMALFTK